MPPNIELMKKQHLLFAVLISLFTITLAFSQPGGPGGPPPTPGEDDNIDDVPAPINTLVMVGLGVGAVFGIRKLK